MTEITRLSTKIYILSEKTFTKKEYAESERPKDLRGDPIIWKHGRLRLQNEFNALRLVGDKTTIAVPKAINFGEDESGAAFLEVERINGIDLISVGDKCRMPSSKAHVVHGKCVECENIAVANVDRYMRTVAIPQLHALKSNQIGLYGLVIPPARIQENDDRDVWLPKQIQHEDFVFCHGDLSRHNILVDPHSLELLSICDWETAGYYPQEIELPYWCMDYNEYMATYEDKARIEEHIKLIQ